MLARCGELHHRWLVLADHDRDLGVDDEDENGAGHRAYLDYDAEHSRLYAIPIPKPRPYAWLSDQDGLSLSEHWGGVLHAGYNKDTPWPRVRPVTKLQAHLAMGWTWMPEPTEAERAAMRRWLEAMNRVDTSRYTEDVPVFDGRMTVSTMVMGEDYFKELAANLREIEAEEASTTRAPNPSPPRSPT